jgi:hypothetical protein
MYHKKVHHRKGYYFILDAIFASILLVGGLVALSQYSTTPQHISESEFFSQDLLTVLSSIKIYELNETYKNNSFVVSEIDSGNITNQENSVLEQVGEYWAIGQQDKARALLDSLMTQVDLDKNFEIIVSNAYRTDYDTIYNTSSMEDFETVTASRRMISGIEKGSPLSGFTSAAYLRKISGKKTNSYAYFGGFVGQGDINVMLALPSDFNGSKMLDAVIKVETSGTFELYINAQQCGSSYSGNANQISLWNIAGCNSSFNSGDNDIEMHFTSPLNQSYISGGFIKLTYMTDTLLEASTSGYKRYYFPSIDGFINLYDSFAVQGILNNWTINVTFNSLYDVFLTIGDDTITIPGQNDTRNIYLTQDAVNSIYSTVPLRMGVYNLSNITIIGQGVPSDSFLVTDISGSMDDCSGQYITTEMCRYQYKPYSWSWWWSTVTCEFNNVSCNSNECGVSPLYSTRNYQVLNQSNCLSLLDVAKEADSLFVDIIFNESTSHRVGLVDYSTNAYYENLTNIADILKSRIDGYSASGSTCTCCGINLARNLINSSVNKKFIVVLSDGEPNYYCSNYNDYTGINDGSIGDAVAIGWAINASKLACQNNITVYAIGFGTAMSASGHSVMQQIACNSSLYYNATDAAQLAEIYRNISMQILVAANFSSQIVTVVGNFSHTKLYPNSYIDIYYDDVSNISETGKLSVVRESDQFNGCSASIFIPSNIVVADAYVTSYSGSHWTDVLSVNDDVVFNLTNYGSNYDMLGDPFIIQVPALSLNSGVWNNISLRVGDSPFNSSTCSDNNTLIYTALVNVSIPRSPVLSQSEGCVWHMSFEDGQTAVSPIPSSYSGINQCFYNSTNISYNIYDAYDVSVFNILRSLDFDSNGLVDVNLNAEDLEVIVTTIDSVPYLWGPSIIEARVWR